MRGGWGKAWPARLACGLLLIVALPAVAQVLHYHREPVLGTSFDLRIAGVEAAMGERMLAVALEEIDVQEMALSRWRDDSALSRLNTGEAMAEPAAALREVLRACERWRERTAGAFSCRLGGVADAWRRAADAGQVPDRAVMRRWARGLSSQVFDPGAARLAAPEGMRFDLDGIAKGWILDRVLARLRERFPQARGIAVDIGGDGAYWGSGGDAQPWPVAVADPRVPNDNRDAPGLARLRLADAAVASSGHASRGYRVGRRQFSHVLDPMEGWPMAYAPSATVVAPDAATADALATALSVMPVREGLALVDSLPGVAALVMGEQGVAFASARWPGVLDPGQAGHVPARRGSGCVLRADYAIPAIEADRYRNPCLALWIARPDGTPVRQLLVLGDRSRWLAELPAWWRHYGRNDTAAALGIARPTRRPGAYRVDWDGRDDLGRAVPEGHYLLQIEAAREHSGHDFASLGFNWRAQAPVRRLRASGEIGAVSLRPACARG